MIGLVAQAELWQLTGDKKYLDGALITLSDWLPFVTTYQMTWGRERGFIPTFMAVDAMMGAYSAAFENHNSGRYLAKFIAMCGNQIDPVILQHLKRIIKFSSGVSRYAYPDKLPNGLLSKLANGAGQNEPNFHNNGTINIPVEDLRWDSKGPAVSGLVGQEAYGAGAGADFALLAETYGSFVARQTE